MPFRKTVVIDMVALTPALLEHAPRLLAYAKRGASGSITPQLPAVTCSAQATYLTGKTPDAHGVVGNGWYFRDECEVKFWRQSNKLVQAQKIWEEAKSIDPTFTCANLFWWFNMYSSADYTATPRPMYPADGRKIPDIYTSPANLRDDLQKELGMFPLFNFWGPKTSIASSKWIADAARLVDKQHNPTLTLIYLPHLDYGLQKFGPDSKEAIEDIKQLDNLCGNLIDYYETKGASVILLSEYGIMPVSRPIHINRILRKNNLLAVREELGRELLDAGRSRAFAVSDHQIAHIYVNDQKDIPYVQSLLQNEAGISEVLSGEEKKQHGLNHERAGELIAIAEPDSWFTYYYWLDDERAPDFARTVDIHRKPGYDPAELFIDPKIKLPFLKILWTLLKKKLGFRTLLDVIPLDATLVKGSHGTISSQLSNNPIVITNRKHLLNSTNIKTTDVYGFIMAHLKE